MLAPRKWVCSSAWLERTPDKGEVGSSSLPRPTIHFNTNRLYIKASARFSKECLNSISHMLTKIFGGTLGELSNIKSFTLLSVTTQAMMNT